MSLVALRLVFVILYLTWYLGWRLEIKPHKLLPRGMAGYGQRARDRRCHLYHLPQQQDARHPSSHQLQPPRPPFWGRYHSLSLNVKWLLTSTFIQFYTTHLFNLLSLFYSLVWKDWRVNITHRHRNLFSDELLLPFLNMYFNTNSVLYTSSLSLKIKSKGSLQNLISTY